jgi:hypothetical protein
MTRYAELVVAGLCWHGALVGSAGCSTSSPPSVVPGSAPQPSCDEGKDASATLDASLTEVAESDAAGDVGTVDVERPNEGCRECAEIFEPTESRAIPVHGIHAAGSAWQTTREQGIEYHRVIVPWYWIADEDGRLRDTPRIDEEVARAEAAGQGFVLSLRPCHPTAGSIPFEVDDFEYQNPDTPPRDPNIWAEVVRTLVTRYRERGLVGFQLGNELSQFRVADDAVLGEYDGDRVRAYGDEYLALLRQTHDAVKEADPRMPVVTTGLDTLHAALLDGLIDRGFIYEDTCRDLDPPRELTRDVLATRPYFVAAAQVTRRILTEGAPYFDYADVHIYADYVDEVEVSARWVEDAWAEAGTPPRGLISLEFGLPLHTYSLSYFAELINSARAAAFAAGFDSIAWSSFYPTAGWSINFTRTSLVDEMGRPRFTPFVDFATFNFGTQALLRARRNADGAVTLTTDGGTVEVPAVTEPAPPPNCDN